MSVFGMISVDFGCICVGFGWILRSLGLMGMEGFVWTNWLYEFVSCITCPQGNHATQKVGKFANMRRQRRLKRTSKTGLQGCQQKNETVKKNNRQERRCHACNPSVQDCCEHPAAGANAACKGCAEKQDDPEMFRYVCPFCHGIVTSRVRTGQVDHRTACGKQFRLREGCVASKAFVYGCLEILVALQLVMEVMLVNGR